MLRPFIIGFKDWHYREDFPQAGKQDSEMHLEYNLERKGEK